MARRRRAFSSCSCFSAFFLLDLVCFQERTSFVISNFAQSRRRRFTGSKSGVSLLGADAEPSDHKTYGESLVVVASDPGSFQIWQACSSTGAIFLFFVDRDLFSEHIRRLFRHIQCLPPHTSYLHGVSPSHNLRRHSFGRRSRRASLVTNLGQDLGMRLQRMNLRWAWPINDYNMSSFVGLFGSWPIWRPYLGCPNFLTMPLHHPSFKLKCRHHLRFVPPPLLVPSTNPSIRAGDSTKQDASLPLPQSSSCRGQEKSYPSSSCLKERIIPLVCLFLRTVEFDLLYHDNCSSPRYQNSSCRGQRETFFPHCSSPRYQNSSCRGQREIVVAILLLEGENFSTIILVFMAFVCACVARSGLELEGLSSESLLSDIFKGSANWCFVTLAKVADVLIVISVLVTVSISNSRSLVLFAFQGLVSLTSSKIVKVRRLHDIYGLSVKIACIYPFIFYACVFRLLFVAAMAMLSSVVTKSSFYGEY